MLGPIAATRSRVPIARTPVADEPGEEPAPARVEDADSGSGLVTGTCERDRDAVRREQQHRAARLVAPQPVAVVVHGAGRDDAARLCARDRRSVPLPGHRRSVRIGADGVAETDPVLDDARRIVLGEDAEVERLERALAHAADPRRERDAVRPRGVPLDDFDVGHD